MLTDDGLDPRFRKSRSHNGWLIDWFPTMSFGSGPPVPMKWGPRVPNSSSAAHLCSSAHPRASQAGRSRLGKFTRS